MSLLWVTAVLDGVDYGEPPEEYVRQIKYDHLRAHYDDPEYNDPDVVANKHIHDHYDERGPYSTGWCRPGAEDCAHPATDRKMREIAQQDWDVHHRRLFRPDLHEQAEQRAKDQMSTFLLDYKLEHPDRVFPLNPDGSLGEPDDPRIRGS